MVSPGASGALPRVSAEMDLGSEPPRECDIVVVGGGILGLAVARELLRRRPIIRLCVLEAESRLAAHQTSHSSGVIHAGIYYEPGSLKAALCVEGAKSIYRYCDDHDIPYRRDGKLIVASDEEELPALAELERRGHANHVDGLTRIGAEQIREIEPHARGIAALHSPHTGVVDFASVARSFAGDVESMDGTVHCGRRVIGSGPRGGRVRVRYEGGSVTAAAAVFCAGLQSDRLAVEAGAPKDPRIVPFRGAYLRLRPEHADLVRSNIYPVPDPDLPFLGAHFTRGIDGKVLIGPTAMLSPGREAYKLRGARPGDLADTLRWPGTWKMMRRHRRAGMLELRRSGRRYYTHEAAHLIPELEPEFVTRGPAGVRAQALGRDGSLIDDFVVHETDRAIHVRNAPSPAATSSLALAKMIAGRVGEIE